MKNLFGFLLIFFSFFLTNNVLGAKEGGQGDYKEMTPPFVVNLDDPRQTSFLQISIAVQSSDSNVLQAIDTHAPLIRNNLLMLFAGQNKKVVATKEGREKLRASAEETINSALNEVGVPPVEALYFTGLVIQ